MCSVSGITNTNHVPLVLKNVKDGVKESFKNLTSGLKKKIQVIDSGRLFYRLYSISGLEKIVKLCISIFRFLGHHPVVKDALRGVLQSFEQHKDACYATLFLGGLFDIIQEDDEGNLYFSFKEPAKVLNVIGAIFEFDRFLKKRNVCKLIPYEGLADKLAQVKVLGFAPFNDIPVLNFFAAHNARDFFVISACFYEMVMLGTKVVKWVSKNNKPTNSEAEKAELKKLKQEIFSTETLLKAFGNTGKIGLILLSKRYGNELGFKVFDVTVQLVSLLSFVIKSPRKIA